MAGELAYVIATVPLVNQEIQRGKLLSKIDYNKNNLPIQKISHTYQLKKHDAINAVSLRRLLKAELVVPSTDLKKGYGILSATIGVLQSYVINKYQLFSQSNLLTQSTSSMYDMNGENPVTKITNYFYENDNHLQPTRVETTNSKEEILRTKTYYAHDVNNQRLINEHRIIEPIKIENYVRVMYCYLLKIQHMLPVIIIKDAISLSMSKLLKAIIL